MALPPDTELLRLAAVVSDLSQELTTVAQQLEAMAEVSSSSTVAEAHDNPDGEDSTDDLGLEMVEPFRTVTRLPEGFKGRRERRSLANVVAVVIHQTAVRGGFGLTAAALQRRGGDRLAARMDRYRSTPYHALYSPADRASIIQWPAWAYSYHGHASNSYSVGWAYDGKFPGDDLQVEHARASLAHLVEVVREAGAPLNFVEAHRQHSAQRGGDPGEAIWREVVMPSLDKLGLTTRAAHTTRDGLELPQSWLES